MMDSIIGSAKRSQEDDEEAFGPSSESESSDTEDLFASLREAMKSGDDKAGAEALQEFISACSGSGSKPKAKGLVIAIGRKPGMEDEE